ncbi:MAG: hypothetical protein Q4C73_02770 [Eubacteriales bacterium]|nr:hypothetical protein [Eubacteriales bacterium]
MHQNIKHAIRNIKLRGRTAACVLGAAALTALLPLYSLSAQASDKPVETIYLGEPEHVWWETETTGKWSSVKKAKEYQVRLYISDYADRDEENWRQVNTDDGNLETVVTVRTSELSYDFTEWMDDLHTYFFAVRAVPEISQQAYVEPGNWVGSPDTDFKESPVIGVTEGRWRNYLEGSRYETEDGAYLSAGWHLIRGSWYLLDENGYRLTGWQTVDGSRYYLGEDGKMAKGWFVYEGNWYYADENGRMQTGWVMDQPGIWYYLNEDGTMAESAPDSTEES